MSTPIEIVRAHIDARVVTWGTQADVDLDCALASVLRDAERLEALEKKVKALHWATEYGDRRTTLSISGPQCSTLAELADRLREGAK